MKRGLGGIIALLFLPMAARANWGKQFSQSGMQFKVYVQSRDETKTTAGFYLTSFPCYSHNANEYYTTEEGKNLLSLYCLEPPAQVMLSYITKPRGAFIAKNETLEGYMVCPVGISGMGKGSVIPRLEVVLENCSKRELNRGGNRDMLSVREGDKGASVIDFMSRDAPAKAAPVECPVQNSIGTIPYIEGTEP